MTKETENREATYETNSQRYGIDKSVEEVFEIPTKPTAPELIQALTATNLLTEKEATAFVTGQIEGFPPQYDPLGEADGMVERWGFDHHSEFKSKKQAARDIVAEATWVYELIDAYRLPDFPEECHQCGEQFDSPRIRYPDNGDSGVLCSNCEEIDPDQAE